MKLLVAIGLWVAAAASNACDVNAPRCKASNELIDVLGYKELIAEVQMKCRGATRAQHPDTIMEVEPGRLLGIMKGTDSWFQLTKAYDMFVDEACGGDEIIYLLREGYRYAWDVRLSGDGLERGLALAKEGGRKAVDQDAAYVSGRVNQVMGPILARMARVAMTNYEARIKGVLTGQAMDIAAGDTCLPGQ